MKCPSCGFENIPGRTECGVCLGTLQAGGPGSIYPPRARDRTNRQRWEWFKDRWVRRSPVGLAIQRTRDAIATLREAYRPGFGPVDVAKVLGSVVPGMGYRLVWGDRRSARLHLSAAIVMLLGAVLMYRAPLSDVLALGVVGLSMFSVAVAVEGLRGPAAPVLAGRRMMATMLLTLAAYAVVVAFLMVILEPRWMVGRVTQRASAAGIRVGDRVLFTNGRDIGRGHVVTGIGEHIQTDRLGPVVGLPGETVTVVLDGRIYVGTRLALTRIQSFADTDTGTVMLAPDEVWVTPNVQVQGEVEQLAQLIARAGVTRRSSLRRAVAVVGPPWRRRLVTRQDIFQEGE